MKFLQRAVLRVDVVEAQSLWGYSPETGNAAGKFLKITMTMPSLVATARTILEQTGVDVPGRGTQRCSTFESNVAYVLRFMVDKDVRGGGWVQVPGGKYQVHAVVVTW
jgi:DNA polymerase delta subunit 1